MLLRNTLVKQLLRSTAVQRQTTSKLYLMSQHYRLFSAVPPTPPPMRPRGGAPPQGTPGQEGDQGAAGYTTDEDGANFDSDRRFSNFILFSGALALAILFMVSNVLHIKKEKEAK